VFYVLSLGPTLKIFSTDTNLPLPYRVLMNLPPFDISRTPVRFVTVAAFFLMFPAADGLVRLQKWLAPTPRKGNLLLLGVLLATLVEVYTPRARQPAFVPPQNLPQRITGPVFNIPLRAVDGYAALLQVFHRQPIATGYIARDTWARRQRFAELQEIYDRGGPEFCSRVAALGFQTIVVTRGEELAPFDLATCKIPVVDLRAEVSWTPAGAPSDERRFPPYSFGQRLELNAAATEPYLWYGWSGPESAGRWTERGSAAIRFSLATVRAGVLRIEMAPFVTPQFPVQTVRVKLNDRFLTSLSLAEGQLREYRIALPADQLQRENVLVFELPAARSPKSLGLSDDSRLLGINVHSFEIDSADR
jgi:hypothetical protein